MKDLDDMTPEELRAWDQAQRAKARARFAGQPVPEISRAKRDDYPHWEHVGWSFKLRPGKPARVRLGRDSLEGTVVGLRPVEDGGPLALLVELADGGTWAFRRADGEVEWAPSADEPVGTTQDLDVPVTGWQVTEPAHRLPAPTRSTSATVRTARLDDDE